MRGWFSVLTHSVARAVELARLGEELGYERCWVYDEGLAAPDVYVTMTAIAAATNKIEIGPGITNPYTRHAGTTASAVAAIDEFSGGRAFLGIGAGGSLTLDPLAIERRLPLTAVSETISACRQMFRGDVVSMHGRAVNLSHASLLHPCSDTEIWLAGRGPKMLELGGGACDGVYLDFVYKPELPSITNRIRNAGRASGNNPRLSYSTMLVTDDATMDCAKLNLTYRLVDSPPEVQAAIGLSPADSEAIRSAMADGLEVAARLVRDEWVFPFVVAGTPSGCASEIRQLEADHDIDAFVVPLLNDDLAEGLLEVGAEALEIT